MRFCAHLATPTAGVVATVGSTRCMVPMPDLTPVAPPPAAAVAQAHQRRTIPPSMAYAQAVQCLGITVPGVSRVAAVEWLPGTWRTLQLLCRLCTTRYIVELGTHHSLGTGYSRHLSR